MKKLNLFIALVCMFCMSSCVYSLFPIYTEDTIVFLPELVGSYENGNSTMKFEPSHELDITSIEVSSDNPDEFYVYKGDTLRDMALISKAIEEEMREEFTKDAKFYKLTVIEEDQDGTKDIQVFRTHLVQIGNDFFLDLYPDAVDENVSCNGKSGTYHTSNFMRVHTFMKIEIGKKELALTQFKLSKLRDLFKSNLIRLRHELVDDEVLITAQPKEIQKFIEKYSKDPSVYENTDLFARVTP